MTTVSAPSMAMRGADRTSRKAPTKCRPCRAAQRPARPPRSLGARRNSATTHGKATTTTSNPTNPTAASTATASTTPRGTAPTGSASKPTKKRPHIATVSTPRSMTRVPNTRIAGERSSSWNASARNASPTRNGTTALIAKPHRNGRTQAAGRKLGSRTRKRRHQRRTRTAWARAVSANAANTAGQESRAKAAERLAKPMPPTKSHRNAPATTTPAASLIQRPPAWANPSGGAGRPTSPASRAASWPGSPPPRSRSVTRVRPWCPRRPTSA